LPQTVGDLVRQQNESRQTLLRIEKQQLQLLELLAKVAPASMERWLSLKELCEYLPQHPSKATVYSWVQSHTIPYCKRGKSLLFNQCEIDKWINGTRRLTEAEIDAEASKLLTLKN